MNEITYNTSKTAELLAISRQQVYNRYKAGEFPSKTAETRGKISSEDIFASRRREVILLRARLKMLEALEVRQTNLDVINQALYDLNNPDDLLDKETES